MENQSNENKLKELTFQHAKMVGQRLQEEIQNPIKLNEVNAMNDAITKGLQENLIVDEIRHLLQKINSDEMKDVPIPDNSPYKYALWLYQLACLSTNVNLINFAKEIKEKTLHETNK